MSDCLLLAPIAEGELPNAPKGRTGEARLLFVFADEYSGLTVGFASPMQRRTRGLTRLSVPPNPLTPAPLPVVPLVTSPLKHRPVLGIECCEGRARAILLARAKAQSEAIKAFEDGELSVETIEPDGRWIGNETLRRLQEACNEVPDGGRGTYNGQVLRETADARSVGLLRNSLEMASRGTVSDPDLVHDVATRPSWSGPDPRHEERIALPEDLDYAEVIAKSARQ